MAKYVHEATVLPQGPGRSKILITAEQDWRHHLEIIVDSISRDGGTGCINATAVLLEGDPAPLASAIADRLAAIPSLPPHHDQALLPIQPLAAAQAIEKYLHAKATGATALLGGDGSAALRPAVHLLERADTHQIGTELPFPCVRVAPWHQANGISPLRNSLVLTAITDNPNLIDDLLAEPSIINVYLGDTPTYWLRPGIPHDSYLSDFLMRSKAVTRHSP